jgi:hypothetical protein
MEHDLHTKYDSLCYATFLNIKYLTSGANYIYLKNFDYYNDEHHFVLAVANACFNILGEKELLVDVSFFQMKALKKKYSCFNVIRKPKGEPEKYVDVPDLLEYMRGAACDLCGPVFTFGDIYHEYYGEKE